MFVPQLRKSFHTVAVYILNFNSMHLIEILSNKNTFENIRSLIIFLADQCPRMQAPTDGNRFSKKSLCVRMRSSLTKRAPNMKTPGYRVRYFSILNLFFSIKFFQ
jgi:hypothetical protein